MTFKTCLYWAVGGIGVAVFAVFTGWFYWWLIGLYFSPLSRYLIDHDFPLISRILAYILQVVLTVAALLAFAWFASRSDRHPPQVDPEP